MNASELFGGGGGVIDALAALEYQGSPVFVTGGPVEIPAFSFAGGAGSPALSGNIQQVADITNPSGWTEIASIELEASFGLLHSFSTATLRCTVGSADDASVGLRCRVSDGSGILNDVYCIGDSTNNNVGDIYFYQNGGVFKGLKIEACYMGTPGSSTTQLSLGGGLRLTVLKGV